MKTVSQNTRETSGRILLAAARLFAQFGYDGVSIKAISQAAGTNSALISYYFGGKPQLYEAVLNQQAEWMLNAAEKLKEFPQMPLTGLIAFLDELVHIYMDEPHRLRVLYREFLAPTREGNDVVAQRMMRIRDLLTEALESARELQSVRPDIDSRRAAFVLISIVAFYLLTYQYEAISETTNLSGADAFSRVRNVYLDYLNTLSTGREVLK
ncbi:MAG: TetR/AcrR family transcriptional regulator [Acidaminococcaceae bacterium]|nr:TetR/AcrR family transcriptional regulator [Acidaminococcaceae bacterium]